MNMISNRTHLNRGPARVWSIEPTGAFALDKYWLAVNWTGKSSAP